VLTTQDSYAATDDFNLVHGGWIDRKNFGYCHADDSCMGHHRQALFTRFVQNSLEF